MKQRLFREEQRFQGTDLLIATGLCLAILTYGFLENVLSRGEGQATIWAVIAYTSVIAIAGFWFWQLTRKKQENIITDRKLICKISARQKHKRKLKLKNITQLSIITTPLSAQWSGGNIAYRNEELWAINGRTGLSISTKDGKQYFIGSQKPQEMANAIQEALKQA